MTSAFPASSSRERNGSVAGKDEADGRGQPWVYHTTMLDTIGRNWGFRSQNCQRFLEHDVPQSSSISKKRKKSRGIQSTVVDSSRSSKRLRGTTEDSGRGL